MIDFDVEMVKCDAVVDANCSISNLSNLGSAFSPTWSSTSALNILAFAHMDVA